MTTRPIMLDSRLIRSLCPLSQPSRKLATAANPLPPRFPSSPSLATPRIDNDQIARLASKPLHPLSLADLVRHGRPPLSESALFDSANFTLSLLPTRLAHRIHALRSLPFIVVSNPHIAQIYSNYIHSLSTLLPWQEKSITNLSDEIQFTEVMADLVQTHANTIPILARGFLEARKYISPLDVTRFLDEHLRARIGTRLIAEQHLALHLSSQPHSPPTSPDHPSSAPDPTATHIGVIDTALRPADILRHCEATVGDICELKYGVRPTVLINGQPDTRIAHVPTHLEYILTELLKNAFRATIETGQERSPVEITIAASSPEPEFSSSQDTAAAAPDTSPANTSAPRSTTTTTIPPSVPALTIRIRDRGGGIPDSTLPHIWGYSFTTFSEDDMLLPSSSFSSSGSSTTSTTNSRNSSSSRSSSNNGTTDALNTISNLPGSTNALAGLGYGLPLGRAYAEYFGGELSVQSLSGWGADVYLRLRGLGGVV